MTRSRWLLAVAMVVVLLAAVTAWQRPTTPLPASAAGSGASELLALPRPAGSWPGAHGLSGVNGDPVLDRAHVERFCAARGRACQIAHTYTDRTTYESMTRGSDWVFEFYTGFPGALVISQGLTPDSGGAAELAACASGAYDHLWRDFGSIMVRHDRADAIVRLGWEFNGDFMPWSAGDTQTWIGCYRRAADGIRQSNPKAILDWTINAHNTPAELCGGVSTNCYPGDEYVDIIGIDNYDHWPASRTEAEFDATAAAPEGLDWLYAFAKQRGKLFSVGEWGVVPTGDAGRENPDFVRWMHAWFAAHAPDLAYEAYFSDCTPGGVQSSLFRSEPQCQQKPASAAAYRELFGM
ncbi:glycoside hydrolase family 26 protein [Micromonospora craniellae]|uniref:GH26 domain-containing protein n=1 Tax=Micromonospora craniellae TaxID=2294034 RepID=A0A372G6Y4_9ACTN|nr:glycosyl hydrolase [Micromonospora craniellae]QOC90143.1 hypothetical protein ID554_18265 [Micromonospora craniellae]RFS48470.1 hypothetical protein D0Q02_03085 [Micromonospora craniellae]